MITVSVCARRTTFLREIAGEGRTYLSLDDPRLVELARSDPPQFMQRYPGPVIIDEIQYAPGLLPYIKMAVDVECRPGRFRCLNSTVASGAARTRP
ncbi:MAG: hypothetical protein IPG61_16900 [bacterium]|nr:hypothetical protein [bacterium]